MNTRFSRSLRAGRGATAVEYIVMLILAALVVLGIVKVFGGTVSEKFSNANDELAGTLASDEARAADGRGGSGGDGSGAATGMAQNQQLAANRAGAGAGASPDGQAGAAGSPGGAASGGAQGAAAGKADGAASGGGKGKGSGGDGVASDDDKSPNAGVAQRPEAKKKAAADAGINPIVIFAALLLLGVLFYVMSSGKKD